MTVVEEIRGILRKDPSLLFAMIGLGALSTSASSYRLNALVGIYEVDYSLVARHLVATFACLAALLLGGRQVCQKWKPACVASLAASALGACILAKYSQHILVVSDPAAVAAGRLLEEGASVVFGLIWANAILRTDLRSALFVFGGSEVVRGVLQLLLSVFQRIPCMFALALFPLVSLALYCFFEKSRGTRVSEGCPAETGIRWPMNLQPRATQVKFLLLLFCFAFIVGQLLYPSLEIQQLNVSNQLSIALGNLLSGILVLFIPPLLNEARRQPRLALSLMFLLLFGLVAAALSLHSYLNTVTVTIYLTLATIVLNLLTCQVWLACYSRLGREVPPIAAYMVGTAVLFLSRACSCATMLVSNGGEVMPGSYILVFLSASFVLCLLMVFSTPDAEAEASVIEGGVTAPFKHAVGEIGAECGLTNQETRILLYVAKGNNAKKIAEILQLSPNTVKSHMRTVYAKLGVHSQQEIIDMVFEAHNKSADITQ